MERIRKPFQGVRNIVRFNWHFYLLSASLVCLIFFFNRLFDHQYLFYSHLIGISIAATTILSLLASFYIYDLSGLYSFNWLVKSEPNPTGTIVNINAGFDETSVLLKARYPTAELLVFDFYDPAKHTEVSIKRARKAYPPYPNTQITNTSSLSIAASSVDMVYVILAAHEIRNEAERTVFFKELNRIAKQTGTIVVVEHLRDWANFLAYTIGFFHFLPKPFWYKTFASADLTVTREVKITPFITTFFLNKNGVSS